MPLSGSLLQQAQNAILAGYTRDGLRQTLTVGFDLSLDALVAEKPFADQVLDLLSRAERTGNLLALLRCLADGRPANRAALDAVCAAVEAAYGGSPPPPDPSWGIAGPFASAALAEYEERYLSQLRRECRYIRTEGVGESPVELADVFVMLQAIEAPRPLRSADAAGFPDVASTPLRRAEMGLADRAADRDQVRASERNLPPPPPPVPLAQAMREHTHLVVLGEPGSGKSTTLQFLALCFAAADAPHTRLAIDETRVPIWLELRTWTGDRPFADWLAQGIGAYGLFHPANSAENERIARLLLDHWLGERRVILLLDALDEALDPGRGALLREIDRFAGTAAGAACRIVLTSRIGAYSAEQRPGWGFEQYVIHPFGSEADALPYAAGWLEALSSEPLGAEAARQEAQRLLAQMRQQEGLRRIFTNPLLLRLAITVHLTTGEPLRSRAEIYRRYVDEVLWERSQWRNTGGFTKGQVQQALACVAWTLHQQPQTPAPALAGKISAAEGLAVDGHAVLVFLQGGLGLLGAYDYARGALLAFRHLTFQEFLVGRRLAKLWAVDQEAAWRLLRPRLHHPAWREPLLLMAGLLDRPAALALARRVLAARSPFERELHRDLALAITLLADAGCTDAEMIRQVVDRVLSLVAHSRAPALLPESVWVLARWLWGPGLCSGDQFVQLLKVLSGLGKPAVPPLIQALSDADRDIRWTAIEALGKLGDPAAVPPLIEALSDPDDDVRSTATQALGELGDAAAAPPLIEALSDLNDDVRSTAAEALGKLGDAAAVPPLIQAVFDADIFVRKAAAEALGELDDAAAAPPLIEALSDLDDDVRSTAAEALGKLGDAAAVPPLIQAIFDSGYYVRWAAAEALGKIGDTAVPHLIQALSDADGSVRSAAAEALGKLGDAAAVPPLIQAVFDADYSVRWAAAEALGEIGDPAAVPHLIQALSDTNDFVYWAAARALGKIGDPAAVPPLIQVLSDATGSVRWAAEALGELGDPAAVPPLIQALSDADDFVRWAAAEALGKLGDAAAVPPLIQALSDADDSVRQAAAEALGKLGDAAAVPHLIQALSDADDSVCQAAAEALGKLGDAAAVPHLIQALSDADDSVRWRAAEALGKLGDAAAVPHLIQALSDADDSVRWRAAEALGKLGEAAAVPHLIQALSDADYSVRWRAAEALGEILAGKNQFDPKLLQQWAGRLVKLAYHRDEDVRQQAVRVLERVALLLATATPVQSPAVFDPCP